MSETSETNKGICEKPIANLIFNREKLNAFPPRSGIRQGCIFLQLLLKIVLEILVSTVRQDKETKVPTLNRSIILFIHSYNKISLHTYWNR